MDRFPGPDTILLLAGCLFCLCLPAAAFNLDARIPIVKQGDRGSYFGYSVAQHKQVLTGSIRKNQLLVGAPKANTPQPNTVRPGTVFVCPVTTYLTDCQQIDLRNFTKDVPPPSDEYADDGWLGGSLESRGVGGQVVACAHRYRRSEGESIWGQGMCLLFSQDLSYDQIYEPCGGQQTTHGHEDFGFCQAGVASELAEDGSMTIGAPGIRNWRGGIFSTVVRREDSIGADQRWFASEMNQARAFVSKVAYLGMSITSGYYSGRGEGMVYIAGAPRENLTGEVLMFRKHTDGTNRTLEMFARLKGDQVASQFGYSMASLDLNNDSLPDLVVGCPFYFQNEPSRGGAVYIYLNNEDGIQYAEPKKLLGPVRDSSFGFAVANAGDLNLDGFEELAVGAPYEGFGAIYIFQGSATGVVVEPSQIIRATDLPVPGLKTLGYSLSGGIDLDDNGYPDLLSGNFASDSVVLFRARPVIKVATEVLDLPRYVSEPHLPPKFCLDPSSGNNLTCFSFRPCFRISSQNWVNFNGAMSIQYRIEAETFHKSGGLQYSRVKFLNAEDPPNVVTRDVVVTANSWNRALCGEDMRQTVLLLNNTRDVLNPVLFKLTYTILQDSPLFPAEGAPLPRINDYPILDQTNASKVFDVKFYKDCGENDICESDLKLAAALNLPVDGRRNYILSLGENKIISLNLTVRNENESAYETKLFIQHPDTFDFIKSDQAQYTCSHQKDSKTLILCDIGNPLPRNGEVSISMRFNASRLEPLDREVSLTLWTNTTSTQSVAQLPLNLTAIIVVRADLAIGGASNPVELFYSGVVTGASAMTKEEDIGLSVDHIYEIWNRGPAKVSSSKVTIMWPLEAENGHKHGKYLLYLLEKPIVKGPGDCTVNRQHINPMGLKLSLMPTLTENLSPSDLPSGSSQLQTLQNETDHLSRVKREKVVAHEIRSVDNKNIKLVQMNCDRQRPTAKCIQIICNIWELHRNQPVSIRLRARLWNSTFIEDYRDIDTIEIKSSALVTVDTNYQIEDPVANNNYSVLTIAKPDVSIKTPTEGLAWWWILLAVLCGLLLLLVLIFILYRCKFFQRKTVDTRRQTPSDMGDETETKRAMSPQSDD